MSSTLEKISERALISAEQELTRLVGVETTLTLRSGSLVRDADFIDLIEVGHVVVRFEFDGGSEGRGAFAVSKKNAIRVAGKLLMLPIADLNQSVSNEEYDDEYRYAYEEWVKCFVGTYIQSLKQPAYQCTEIRCGKQEIIKEHNSISLLDELRSDKHYFLATVTLTLGGVKQDDVLLLLPAYMVVCGSDLKTGEVKERTNDNIDDEQSSGNMMPALYPLADIGTTSVSESFIGLIKLWMSEVNRDLTAMFGIQVELSGTPKQSVDGQQIWNRAFGHTLLFTSYPVEGLVNGRIAVTGLAEDLMRIGSLLAGGGADISEGTGSGERFDSDREDGFHELCSIILAIGAEWLAEKTSESLVIGNRQSTLVPCDADHPFPDQLLDDQYHVMATLQVAADMHHSGYLHILFPSLLAEQLELVTQDLELYQIQEQPSVFPDRIAGSAPESGFVNREETVVDGGILLINASEHNAKLLRETLETEELDYEQVSLSSEVLQDRLAGDYQSVFLVVDKANEMALSNLIKINALSETPLIVAASQWTQSQVVKALRYGAVDILVTPVTGRELQDKLKGLKNRPTG